MSSAVMSLAAPALVIAYLRHSCSSSGVARSRAVHADPAPQGEQLRVQRLDEPAVTGQHDGQEDVAVETGGGLEAAARPGLSAPSPGPHRR